MKASGPLYLRPLPKFRPTLWYSVQAVGENKIKTYMKTVTTMGGFTDDRRFTNHSIRKTTVRELQKAGISNDKIASITGHKCEESLRDYASTDISDHNRMSLILSNPPGKISQPGSRPSSIIHPLEPPSLSMKQPVESQPQYVFNHCTVYMEQPTVRDRKIYNL